jgi:hypothetical protein
LLYLNKVIINNTFPSTIIIIKFVPKFIYIYMKTDDYFLDFQPCIEKNT